MIRSLLPQLNYLTSLYDPKVILWLPQSEGLGPIGVLTPFTVKCLLVIPELGSNDQTQPAHIVQALSSWEITIGGVCECCLHTRHTSATSMPDFDFRLLYPTPGEDPLSVMELDLTTCDSQSGLCLDADLLRLAILRRGKNGNTRASRLMSPAAISCG